MIKWSKLREWELNAVKAEPSKSEKGQESRMRMALSNSENRRSRGMNLYDHTI